MSSSIEIPELCRVSDLGLFIGTERDVQAIDPQAARVNWISTNRKQRRSPTLDSGIPPPLTLTPGCRFHVFLSMRVV